jgi:ferredoxin
MSDSNQNSSPTNDQPKPLQDFQIETRSDGAIIQSKQIGIYRVEVIRDKCISAASCVAIAPKVFQLDEEGIAIVIAQNGNDDDTTLLAAQSCPTAAIIVINTETNQQVWPL